MTKYKGRQTGFNKTGSNNVTPDFSGPPSTDYCGRGSVPDGKLKHYPGAVANISDGNRRLAKSNHGAGGGSTTRVSTSTAFGRGRK